MGRWGDGETGRGTIMRKIMQVLHLFDLQEKDTIVITGINPDLDNLGTKDLLDLIGNK